MGAALSLLDIGLTSHLQRQIWQGSPINDPDSNIISSGFRTLDLALPGAGWMPGTVTELLIEESGVGEIRLLAHMLRELTVSKGRSVIFIAPPWKPNLAAFRAMKIAVDKLVWVKAPEDQVLWAAEQSLKQEGIGRRAYLAASSTPRSAAKAAGGGSGSAVAGVPVPSAQSGEAIIRCAIAHGLQTDTSRQRTDDEPSRMDASRHARNRHHQAAWSIAGQAVAVELAAADACSARTYSSCASGKESTRGQTCCG